MHGDDAWSKGPNDMIGIVPDASGDEWVARRLRIGGKVQGVGFRWHMEQQARRLGVSGWVRNCSDGSVQALIGGTHDKVAALLYWASQGPPAAQVVSVQVEDAGADAVRALQRDFQVFVQQPTTDCAD